MYSGGGLIGFVQVRIGDETFRGKLQPAEDAWPLQALIFGFFSTLHNSWNWLNSFVAPASSMFENSSCFFVFWFRYIRDGESYR